jgi:hypothetical protein
MKQLLVLFSVLVFASCSTAPDNKIHNQKLEKGGWVYDSLFEKPIQQDIVYVQIAPTWGQSFDYAGKRSDRIVDVIAGFLFLSLTIVFIVIRAKEVSWFPKFLENPHVFNGALFIGIVATVSFFIGDAGNIKFNNYKWIEKTEYEKAITETGSTQPIWDSLENKCLIVYGPYGCYTK